jgi:hypothetical protein
VHTKNISIIAILLFISQIKIYAQYNFVAQTLLPKGNITFCLTKNLFAHTRESAIYCSKLYNIDFPLVYKYNGDCGIFEISGKKFPLNENFDDQFACDLDLTTPSSYKIYKFVFKEKKYYALECITNGSRTSFILIHLFDVTDNKNIIYYPLWSRYGSIKCLGDFNKDGVLDFLKIRNNEKYTGTDTFISTLMSLATNEHKFKDILESKEWVFKRVYHRNNTFRVKVLSVR